MENAKEEAIQPKVQKADPGSWLKKCCFFSGT